MKLRSGSIGIAHQSNLLTAFDLLTFADQQFWLCPYAVRKEELCWMMTKFPYSSNLNRHKPLCRQPPPKRVVRHCRNIDTLVAAAEIGNHFTLGRTLPNNAADRTRAGRRSGRRLRAGAGREPLYFPQRARQVAARTERAVARRVSQGLRGSRYGGLLTAAVFGAAYPAGLTLTI